MSLQTKACDFGCIKARSVLTCIRSNPRVEIKKATKQQLPHQHFRSHAKNLSQTRLVATGAAETSVVFAGSSDQENPLVYEGIIFDMDGTLTISNIDYVRMRQSINIPVGDLFTVMESWDDGERIKRSMDTILEIEATAAAEAKPMPGLLDLLAYLRDSPAKIGLVTRNTTDSVNAFFSVIGEEWRGVFEIVLTREFKHVKPDKRCLLHFAEAWGIPPYSLLMVGDSLEDVECGNAAGTATCLIAGGGNETSATPTAPPLGAVPTFEVESLYDLTTRLALRNTSLGWRAVSTPSIDFMRSGDYSEDELLDEFSIDDILASAALSSSGSGAEEGGVLAGAPPRGGDFIEALYEYGAVQAAYCSFPRIDGARFGVPEDRHPGSRVLHLQCGDGGLSKLIFSTGLRVVGADPAPEQAIKRGLMAAKVAKLDAPGALGDVTQSAGPFDAVVLVASGLPDAPLEQQLLTPTALQEIRDGALVPGGKLCAEVILRPDHTPEAVQQLFKDCGYTIDVMEPVLDEESLGATLRIRVFATANKN